MNLHYTIQDQQNQVFHPRPTHRVENTVLISRLAAGKFTYHACRIAWLALQPGSNLTARRLHDRFGMAAPIWKSSKPIAKPGTLKVLPFVYTVRNPTSG